MRESYITVLSTDNYLQGVLVLHASYIRSKSKFPFHCFITNSVSKETTAILTKFGIPYICEVEPFKIPTDLEINNDVQRFNHTFSKLNVFGLTQFTKIILLDADLFLLANIDDLFEKPHMSAVPSGFHKQGFKNNSHLSSGLIVIEPKAEYVVMLKEYIDDLYRYNEYGDQNIIQLFSKDWMSDKTLHLEEGNHLLHYLLDYYIHNLGYVLDDHDSTYGRNWIRVLHFHNPKPWLMSKSKWMFYKFKWTLGGFKFRILYMKDYLQDLVLIREKILRE